MLHAFTDRPDGGVGLAEEPPSTSGSGPPPHGIDIAKVTATYTALLQVLQLCSCHTQLHSWGQVSMLCVLCWFEFGPVIVTSSLTR